MDVTSPRACASAATTDQPNVEQLKQNFDAILSKFNSLGLSVHLLEDKSLIFPSTIKEPQILDGDDALQHFNHSQYSNKVLSFGQRHFYCHTEYLRLRSSYFDALFAGNYQEANMDRVSIELPATTSHIELLLKYLYTGKANEKLFYGIEIFKTIENANYLGVHDLVALAVEAFSVRWKSLAPSLLFKRSVVDVNFVQALLEYGSKKGVFQDGDKLRLVVYWSAKPYWDFSEAQSLLLNYNCLETADLNDLEWALDTNGALFKGLEFSKFRGICQRARRESESVKKTNKASEEKAKSLLECVRILTRQLEEVRCTRCRLFMPRVALKTRTCLTVEHPGEYTLHLGWSCCKQVKKRSYGCKPMNVVRHTTTRLSSTSSTNSSS